MKSKKGFKKQKIKAVIFDIGGVLQLYKSPIVDEKKVYSGIHEYMAEQFKKDIDSWFDSIDVAYTKSMSGMIDGREAVNIIANNLKTNTRNINSLFKKAYRRVFGKNKELYKIAYGLKKRGYIIGILSDQWHLSKLILIPKKDIKHFDVAIVSCDVKLRKPDVKIYRFLMKELRRINKSLKTSEVLFIDNREWNLKPARKMRMKVILFKDNEQCLKDMKRLGIL